MTLFGRRAVQASSGDILLKTAPRSADATTILAIFVALQFVLPSRLVLDGIPLSLSAATLVALGLGAFWICAQFTTNLGAAKGRNPVRTALFAYSFVLLASYGNASFGYLPADERMIGDHVMVTVYAGIFVALVACDGIRSRARLHFLLRVIVVCGSAVATVGIVQYLSGFDPTPYLRAPGMHFTAFDFYRSFGTRYGVIRASGTTANALEFGVFCAMILPLAIHTAFEAQRTNGRTCFWWMCVGLVSCGLMFSASRSAIVGVTVAALVLFTGWSARRRVRMLVVGAGFLVVIKVLAPGLLGTFLFLFYYAGADSSVQWRQHDYAMATEVISQHFWLGRGLGTWYAPKHVIFDNQYLLTLVDSGVLGLATLVGIVLSALYATLQVGLLSHRFPTRLESAVTDRHLALAVAASLVVVLPTFATFDFLAFPTVSSLLVLLVGIAGAFLRVVGAEVAGKPRDRYAII